ncbi:MAG: hypothetical protein ACRDVG_11290 [Jatrophihabitantaceae bacterium]
MQINIDETRQITTWARLQARGVSPSRIRAQLTAGRWRRWGFAIALHNGPLTRQQRWYVARAHGGKSALLTGFIAAEAYGLTGWEREKVDILVRLDRSGATGSPVPLARHRVRDWTRVRRHPQFAVHVLADALLVAAASFDTPRPGCGLLAAAVQQRLVSPARLAVALDDAARVRHRHLLRAAVDDIAQGSQALSEIDFVRLCRRHRLPAPDQQTVRRDRGGRRRFIDATWRRRDGRLVVVEVDGAVHLSPRRWWDDQLRQNELALADALVLRFPSVVVRTEPALVADQLRLALMV